jgi:hypothetical protein
MRSLWISCLAALLSLALASWNVHAMAHGGATLTEHCGGDRDDGRMAGHHGDRHGPSDARCCCDYVACASPAVVAPALAVGSAEFSVVTYRLSNAVPLSASALRREPDPPRPRSLS